MQKLKVGYEYLIEFQIAQGSQSSYAPTREILIESESGVYYQVRFLDSNEIQWIEKKYFFKKHDRVSYGYRVIRCLS